MRRVAAGIAIRLEPARGCEGRCPWLSVVYAPTQKQHKPRARAKINTGVTRTKRHSPAYGGTRSTMAVPENLASSPAEMRVSWADYPFPGRWAKGDRPSEKRKVDSSILSLTTSSDQGKRPVQDRDPGVFSCWGLSLGPRSKRTIGGSAGTGEQAGPSRSIASSSRAWRQTAASQCALPTRRSRTVRCKCHARRAYQPFQCAASPARKGVTGPGGPAVAGTVEPTVLQTCDRNVLICGNFYRNLDPGTYRAWACRLRSRTTVGTSAPSRVAHLRSADTTAVPRLGDLGSAALR